MCSSDLLTGMLSGGLGGQPVPMGPGQPGGPAPKGGKDEGLPPMPMPIVDQATIASEQAEQQLRIDLVTRAYGTTLPNRRTPSSDS